MSQPSWPAPQPPPPKKPKAPLVLGILIGAAAPVLGILVPVALSALTDGGIMGGFGFAPFVLVMVVLATGAGLLFSDQTRRWGVGILIGLFGMLIIGAGACVAVLVAVMASYNGG